MFGDGSLTFQEFARREPLPLATIHDAVLDFLRGRNDAVLSGAHAVNAYVEEARMTDDVDIMSARAEELAEELRADLNQKFHIAVQVQSVRDGRLYRIEQVRNPKNRHLIDVRPVERLPPTQRVEKVLVVAPPDLIANKVITIVRRQRNARGGTDRADVYRLLLAFPELKRVGGPVVERLQANGASAEVLTAWTDIVAEEILPDDQDSGY